MGFQVLAKVSIDFGLPKAKERDAGGFQACLPASLQNNHDHNKRYNMANKSQKWPVNVAGKFYVDDQCIDCDLCRETAPDFFARNDDGSHSFVCKQPSSAAEIQACEDAKSNCPVDAIGDDGDK